MQDERSAKHDRVAAFLAEGGLDGAVLSRRCNFSWYTCGAHNYVAGAADVGNSWLLVDRERARVVTSNIEATRLGGEELAGSGIEVEAFDYHEPGGPAAALKAGAGGMRLAADAPVPGLELPALGDEFSRLRWALTPWEIDRYRALARDTVAAVESAARRAEPGQTEFELAGLVSAELLGRGCVPWLLLVAADERLRRHRHPLPTTTRAEHTFMLVACAERTGLIAACTRVAAFGRVGEELAAKHRAVATVESALIAATVPGASLGDIFAEAQAAYAEVGFPDEWRRHHQGGSCGYLPREVKAAPGSDTRALANQAFAWNPSIAGTKAEDTILCAADGPEVLAGATDWPTVQASWRGTGMARPEILER